ncbi:MAG: TetR/AcrR family transcriptional regulator [Candidatus Azotimanducaceae bacterium WSBS_2022_MAG_OTU7]
MNDQTIDRSAPDTQEKILDAAECLFVEHGYAATSLRAIATMAGVNLAATNYHFGSKKNLFASVFQRRVQPINEQRLLLLKQLEESERPLTVRALLECFFAPLTEPVNRNNDVPALIGRIYAEPESLTKPILEQAFGETATRYQLAIAEVFPDIPTEELSWRFHFMIGSMIHLLQFNTPLGAEPTRSTFISVIDRMIDYAEAGLTQSNERQ